MFCNRGKDYGKATGQCSAIVVNIFTMRLDNFLQYWKYNGKMTVQCSAVMEKIIARQQDKLCNIEKSWLADRTKALHY
jgi:hypothetical protein